ncbi:MAG: hypothetical protein JXB49_32310 [Bacteroidales bacterium]|nr:hypothetical protein [Bacteroidales bacterium]
MENYEAITPVCQKDWDIINIFDGRDLSIGWRPLSLCKFKDSNRVKELISGDYPLIASHVPTFSKHAAEILSPLIKKYGEFVELIVEKEIFFAFNVQEFSDELDMNKSEIIAYPDNRIMYVKKYFFKSKEVEKLPIFKIAQLPFGNVFVNDEFVSLVKRHDLKGMLFGRIN